MDTSDFWCLRHILARRVCSRTELADDGVKNLKSVIVACTLRSGSNLLCELLERYGFGKPTEFFQHERYLNHESVREYDISTLKPLNELHQEFVDLHEGLQWRGAKWNWFQFSVFSKATEEYSNLSMADWMPNPVWIRLRRRNKIGQAVSMYIAKKTGVWVVGDEAPLPETNIDYDFGQIWNEFVEFSVEDDLWAAYLADTQTPYVEVIFEDLVADFGPNMRRILKALDPAAEDMVSLTDTLPIDARNAAIGSPLAKVFSTRFTQDLANRRHFVPKSNIDLDAIVTALSTQETAGHFTRFIGNEKDPITIRKLDLQASLTIEGPHEWVERSHFLDGVALRLDPLSKATLRMPAKRIYIEFLSHPWSGIARVVVNGAQTDVDLFGVISTRKPWMFSIARTCDCEITIASLTEKASLSSGYEVWLQRIWILS